MSIGADTRTALMRRPLWQVGLAAMIVAAVAAEVFGLLARAIDVPLEAPAMGGDEAEKIFVGGFAVATFFYGVIGILVALGLARWASNPARAWLIVASVGTALSLLAPITAEDTETATKVVLALSHLVVAAIMIPLIAQRLAALESDEPEVAETPVD
jgi:hypothetical protein